MRKKDKAVHVSKEVSIRVGVIGVDKDAKASASQGWRLLSYRRPLVCSLLLLKILERLIH